MDPPEHVNRFLPYRHFLSINLYLQNEISSQKFAKLKKGSKKSIYLIHLKPFLQPKHTIN